MVSTTSPAPSRRGKVLERSHFMIMPMRRTVLRLLSFSILLLSGLTSMSAAEYDAIQGDEIPLFEYQHQGLTYLLADITDSAVMYKTDVVKQNCFHVVSKREYRLYVYEKVENDTILVAHFPICYAKNQGKKLKEGDGKTPESTMQHPCTVLTIEDASKWKHDFGDGRGKISSYGKWFCRLQLPDSNNKTIGIHGSTNNEVSVPGRNSEGCVRLRDEDLITLRDLFIARGQQVIIKSNDQKKLPFEIAAQRKLADRYVAPQLGHPLKGN